MAKLPKIGITAIGTNKCVYVIQSLLNPCLQRNETFNQAETFDFERNYYQKSGFIDMLRLILPTNNVTICQKLLCKVQLCFKIFNLMIRTQYIPHYGF